MKLMRFDKGHFAANSTLAPGTWIFQISARTRGASPGDYFSSAIGEGGV
jgi:nitrogen fixation protein FixH